MEPGQPREAREPGPGAETAAAPRWEEAKTFYDNLSPKKKPKSVKAGFEFGGHGKGHFQGMVSSPLGRDLWSPLSEGDTAPPPQNVPSNWLGLQFILGALLYWQWFSPPQPPSRAQVLLQNIPAPCCHQGPIPSRRWQPERADRTCWLSWSATRSAAPWAPKPGCSLVPSVQPTQLPDPSLGVWALTADPDPRESGHSPCIVKERLLAPGSGLCSQALSSQLWALHLRLCF